MKNTLKTIATVTLKNVLPLVAGLAVLVLVIAWLAGVFETKIAAGQGEVTQRTLPDGAATDTVHAIVQATDTEAVGTLKSASRTEVSSRIMAQIKQITVVAGQKVAVGDVLILLDNADLVANVGKAASALEAARSAEALAISELQRFEQLFPQNAVSKSQLDQSRAARESAQANRIAAEQSLAAANVALSHATITAPQAGEVVEQLVKEGSMAVPGVPLLRIYDRSQLRLEVPVMEDMATKLRKGDKLTVHIDANDRDVTATVDEIVPQAEAASRSFLVKVLLQPDDTLYEGMFGRLKIPTGERRFLCLNTAAIQTVGQLEFVDVVGPDDVLLRRQIQTGRSGIPGRIEVLSGLEADERVVLYGPSAAAPSTTPDE